MSYKKFENTDVYINQNHGCNKGFDVNISFHSIQELAEIFDCNIIVKTKNRWYLKKVYINPLLISFYLINVRVYIKIAQLILKNMIQWILKNKYICHSK